MMSAAYSALGLTACLRPFNINGRIGHGIGNSGRGPSSPHTIAAHGTIIATPGAGFVMYTTGRKAAPRGRN